MQQLLIVTVSYCLKTLTFLSEYHPQKRVVKAATAPAGVDKINVCFDLGKMSAYVTAVCRRNQRVTKTLDDQVADCK